jgi:DNA-binding IclR family transcriptional regulator
MTTLTLTMRQEAALDVLRKRAGPVTVEQVALDTGMTLVATRGALYGLVTAGLADEAPLGTYTAR